MQKRPMGQQPLNQWQYYQMQQQLYDQGYIKKPDCGCNKKKKKMTMQNDEEQKK
ncbi:cytochrome C oxidase subunit III [Bacillus sp. 165]|uniref:cytochrome C oxidase subunit III n=1 Tax=Bacillus sp. 165 TaxID=1529117 RepID=UPI001ADC3EB9|nr:cytochrome C oxidase subunit III [Bacillus sp. 165]MBO9128623.1 cytochrome C oxidase subunit III [Bacillus sp. 165]